MKSTITHQFSQIPKAEIPRSSFDRSHGYKTTFDAGYLIPIYIDEALPGDTFNLNMSAFARLATPLKPVMDNMFLDSFWFAVPMRLVWDNWQRFNGEQDDPDSSTDYVIPTITSPVGGWGAGDLEDYFGLPLGIAGLKVSSLFHRAYHLIHNEWFRDENITDSFDVPKGDGPDVGPTLGYGLRRRCKRHDYFTSCLPWPQKGPEVSLPMATTAPVERVTNAPVWRAYDAGTNNLLNDLGDPIEVESDGTLSDGTDAVSLDPNGGLIADLTSATGSTINALREAFQIQRLYERDARGGTRYTEILRSHFGVISPDFRLQRPELLGTGSSPVNIHPIPQTSGTVAGVTPQANLAAIGTVSVQGHGFTKSFTEHCLLMGMVCVRADLTYQQGINRMFSREGRFDFYWPALSHLGEQAVLNKEIYAQGTADDEEVFGYQERYAEYRYKPSMVTGVFRSSHPQSLDVWHLAQDFAELPTLSTTFINENPPVSRIVAVPSEPKFLFDSYISLKCARPMPVYSVPGLIDHF